MTPTSGGASASAQAGANASASQARCRKHHFHHRPTTNQTYNPGTRTTYGRGFRLGQSCCPNPPVGNACRPCLKTAHLHLLSQPDRLWKKDQGKWDGGADARRITIYQREDFAPMRAAGPACRRDARYDRPVCQTPASTTEALNTLCHDFIVSHGAVPAPLNYRGFPKSICTSINHVGLPRHSRRSQTARRRHPQHRHYGDPGRLVRATAAGCMPPARPARAPSG